MTDRTVSASATPADVLSFAETHQVKMVDLRFVDLLGSWQHTSVPIQQLKVASFEDGFGFDGSSILGYQPINASDLLIVPDPTTAKLDPFTKAQTLVLICNVVDPITKQPHPRDPRFIAKKAESYLRQLGLADVAYFGPEAEFFVFDEIRYASSSQHSFYRIDSSEAAWNTGTAEAPNLGYKVRHKGGYFPVAPTDTLVDLRAEIVEVLHGLGYIVEVSHHEVATAGQCEIDMRYDSLTVMADQLQWFKYVVRNVARRHGKTATFMPKPIHGDNGSGMHIHQSLWKDNRPLFAGDGYAGLSDLALHYIGGVLSNASAVCALSNPTVNSYRRLVPGYEAPIKLAYSSRNRSAAVRIPMYSTAPAARRVEVRFPDPLGNPYLVFSAMLMAGLDGIQKSMHPGRPLDKDIYSLAPEELSEVPTVPASLEQSLTALSEQNEFLLQGDVFNQELLRSWHEHKMDHEVGPSRLWPTPLDFELYFDA